jgi:hypothetical protein
VLEHASKRFEPLVHIRADIDIAVIIEARFIAQAFA